MGLFLRIILTILPPREIPTNLLPLPEIFGARFPPNIIGIRKEDTEKNIRSNTEGRWRVETQNK
jgi:hypothetical protein